MPEMSLKVLSEDLRLDRTNDIHERPGNGNLIIDTLTVNKDGLRAKYAQPCSDIITSFAVLIHGSAHPRQP